MKLFAILLAIAASALAAPAPAAGEHVACGDIKPRAGKCTITATVYRRSDKEKDERKGDVSIALQRYAAGTFKALWDNGKPSTTKQNVDDLKHVFLHGVGQEGDLMDIQWLHGFNYNSDSIRYNYTGKRMQPETVIWEDWADSRGEGNCGRTGWKKNIRTSVCHFPC